MTDILYIAGTIGFFALMLAYVSFCERLSPPETAANQPPESRS